MARLLLLCAALALVATGCGNRHEEPRTFAETEGIYLELGEVYYQVQISRQINPEQNPDKDFLVGVPDAVDEPGEDEAWFGVFIRAWNHQHEPLPIAQEFEIEDANGEIYHPVEVDSDENIFVDWPQVLGPGRSAPEADSTAAESAIGGRLVLFKLPYATFQHRPLEFKIVPQVGEEGVVELDV